MCTSDHFTESQRAGPTQPYELYERQALDCVFYIPRACNEYAHTVSTENKLPLVR